MNNFKENLKRIRMKNGMSQGVLAERTKVDPSHISHYECGRRFPSVGSLIKLSKVLNCTMEELVVDVKDTKKGEK